MRYIEYEEYTELGGMCDLTAFNRNIGRACAIIDNATKKRVEQMTDIPSMVKSCCRDLVDYLSNNTVTDKALSSKSQSAGGVSESESYTQKTADEYANDIDGILCDYLLSVTDDNGTPILYRGLNV